MTFQSWISTGKTILRTMRPLLQLIIIIISFTIVASVTADKRIDIHSRNYISKVRIFIVWIFIMEINTLNYNDFHFV